MGILRCSVKKLNSKLIMGAVGSKRGLKTAIIGDENLAQESQPTLTDPRWTKCGRISQLYIYPVKSLQPSIVTNAIIEKHGLRNGLYLDRQFVIVDEKNKYCNATRYPKLVLINAEVQEKSLILTAPGMDALKVD